MGTFNEEILSMSTMNRRAFLAAGAAGTLALAGGRAFAAEKPAFRMGAQSYCFRNFKFPDPLDKVKEIGLNNIEFCSVHFPPAVGAPGFDDVKAKIAASGVKVLSFGVEGFTNNEDANRVKFDFAKALGIEVLTADPQPNSFDCLDKLTEEYGIKIAIHNHGPQDVRYGTVDKVLAAVKDHSKMIGACVDCGHTIRSGEKPHEVIKALGDRVISMHLKDWVTGGEEQILGEGNIDLKAVATELKALKFGGPVMLEFELSPEDPSPGMKKGLANWKAAVEDVYGASW